MKDYIQDYTDRGWKLIPVNPDSKVTYFDFNKAGSNVEKLNKYFDDNPSANLGLNLKASGLVCLDVDSYKDECEFQEFIKGIEMPPTLVQKSASGGTHYIFKADQSINFAGLLCKGVEIKHKGYVLIEPSEIGGVKYQWETDDEPAHVPDWVPKKSIDKNEVLSIGWSSPGQDQAAGGINVQQMLKEIQANVNWHDNALRLVGHYVAKGFNEKQIWDIAKQSFNLDGPSKSGERRSELQGFIDDAVKKGFGKVTLNSELKSDTLEYRVPSVPLLYPDKATPNLTSNYLVKRWLDASSLSVIYGSSNVGKSFYALDLSYCIAAGIDWHGNKVKQGAVLYLCTEGALGFANRMYAIQQKYNCKNVPLAVRRAPINLLKPEADMADLAACITSVKGKFENLAMIVIDTLSQALGGGDENGSDMMALVRNVQEIIAVTGAHCMLIHHAGKDETRGARGHSSLRAAVSTEIELTNNDGVIFAKATKQRDQEPGEDMGFILKNVELGEDQDGDPVTSAVLMMADQLSVTEAKQKKKPTGRNQQIIFKAFKQLRSDGVGSPNPGGTGWPESGSYWTIPERQLREFATGKFVSSNPHSSYSNALDAMVRSGLMTINEEHVWISTREGRA